VLAVTTGCALGAVLGVRHALEPDHLAAVSTLVAERPRPAQAALLGALWGVGHAAALLVVGVVLLAARGSLPAAAITAAELLVAAMLVVLGVRAVTLALRGGHGPVAAHRHGAVEHVHGGAAAHLHLRGRTLAVRPLIVGLVHGLAGSGGLTALALAEMPSRAGALAYLGAFAIGSVAAMAAVSGLAGASLGRLVRGPRARIGLLAGAGALSVLVGIGWALTITSSG
jgi:hypothetical protein